MQFRLAQRLYETTDEVEQLLEKMTGAEKGNKMRTAQIRAHSLWPKKPKESILGTFCYFLTLYCGLGSRRYGTAIEVEHTDLK